MLAQNWDKHKSKITYPCVVQPKYDGIRCLAHRVGDTIEYWSRNEKPLKNLEHLDWICLRNMDDGDWLDGELYCHTMTFNEIVSAVKRRQSSTSYIGYHIYDRIVENVDYTHRVEEYNGYLAENEDAVDNMHKALVSQGYEGSIIRNLTGYYKHGRSFDLQKRKDWFDEEFPIIDVVEGKGKFTGCAIFVCDTGLYHFTVTAPGTIQTKRLVWEFKDTYIGKNVTVKYQEKTVKGVPRFPIALSVRDYE